MSKKINFKKCQMYDGGEWVIINNNFDRLFKLKQKHGFARFYDDKGGAWVNSTGNSITDKRYYNVGNFIQGFAWFWDKGYNWVNINGYELTNKRYKDAGNFTEEGFATFSDDKGQGYCNTFGFEFRSVNFTWDAKTWEENFKNNKKELLKLEEKLLPDFPRDSMKFYILTKVLL